MSNREIKSLILDRYQLKKPCLVLLFNTLTIYDLPYNEKHKRLNSTASVTVAGLNICAKTKISPAVEQKYIYESNCGKKHYNIEIILRTLEQLYIVQMND